MASQVSKYILRPQLLADIGTNQDAIRRMWPSEASTPAFLDFIRKQYDPTQSAAIEAGLPPGPALPCFALSCSASFCPAWNCLALLCPALPSHAHSARPAPTCPALPQSYPSMLVFAGETASQTTSEGRNTEHFADVLAALTFCTMRNLEHN